MDWGTRFLNYVSECAAQPLGFPACNELWGGVFLFGICVVGIVAIKLIYRNYDHWRDEQRAIEEIIRGKRVASPDVIEQFKWKGDKATESDLSYDEMVNKIKQETAKQKDAYQ